MYLYHYHINYHNINKNTFFSFWMGSSLFINMGPKSKKSYTCTKYLVNVLEIFCIKKDFHRIWEVKMVFEKKKFEKINTNTCSIYLNYLPLKEDIALQLNKFKFHPLNDALR